MKRIIIVYNPRSSRFAEVQTEVLSKLHGLKGFLVGKYEVLDTDVDDNAEKLAKILKTGDLVVAVGGDGTLNIAVNAVMKVEGEVTLGCLPYGNFNDTVAMLGTRKLEEIIGGKTVEMWPLEAKIDEKHFRWAMSYFTMGLFAEACAVFDEVKMRKNLRKKKKSPLYSWLVLSKWYFKNRGKREFLAEFRLNGKLMPKKTTDVVALNGLKMAGLMRGGEWALQKSKFLVSTCGLKSFVRLVNLMIKSIFWRVPGEEVSECVVDFLQPAEFEIQAEGEYKRFKNVKKVEIKKAEKCLKVVKI